MKTNLSPLANQDKSKLVAGLAFIFGLSLIAIIYILALFLTNSQKTIFLRDSSIGSINVSGLNQEEAKSKILTALGENKEFSLSFNYQDQAVSTDSAYYEYTVNVDDSVRTAFDDNHQNLSFRTPFKMVFDLIKSKNYPIITSFNQEKINQLVANLATNIDKEGHRPFAELTVTDNPNSLTLDAGEVGLELNQELLTNQLSSQLNTNVYYQDLSFDLKPEQSFYQLNEEEQEQALARAKKFVGTKINLHSNDYKEINLSISDKELINMLHFPTGYEQEVFDQIIEEKNLLIKREPQNAHFEYEQASDGKIEVKQFQPHRDGLAIDENALKEMHNEIMQQVENQDSENQNNQKIFDLNLPLKVVKPEISLEDTNNLGIKELIGFGDSEYDHSIPNRIYNVALTSEKLDNYVLAPGEEFRFNQALGEVSRRTGYKSAYVISGGKTVLGDGGGVCQVSTTFFRSALDAGLPITKRKAHSYRVSYYELNQKPGIDATVYSGDVDLRFVNDTPGHILISVDANSDDLYMNVEMYGTSDGRSTEIVDHETWDLRPAPPPAYYDTTELPPGKVEQIDWSVSGIKASFKNVIKDKNGEVIREEEYYSNYMPWSAKYLRGVAT